MTDPNQTSYSDEIFSLWDTQNALRLRCILVALFSTWW